MNTEISRHSAVSSRQEMFTLSTAPDPDNYWDCLLPTIQCLSLKFRDFRCLQFVLIITLLASITTFGQDEIKRPRAGSRIIDDTTRQVYGPTTSQVFTQDDIFFDRWSTRPIDTVIHNFHRFDYVERMNNRYQDLGNIGTAIQPIFPGSPDIIGASPGFKAYNVFWDMEPVNYYNTKSPYSNMNVILGGKGRSLTNITYSRNINPRWNFGFDYQGLFIDKQVQRSGKGDRNVRSNYYDLFMSYHTKDSSYMILGNFRRMYLRAAENGGVKPVDDYATEDFFEDNAQPWLTEAESNDLRRHYQIYHQYRVGTGLQIYHQIDSYRQRNQFRDNLEAEVNADLFFDTTVIDSVKTSDEIKFQSIRNEIGVKGNLLKLFYNGFAALRSFQMNYKYFDEEYLYLPTRGEELYVGGRIALDLDSLVRVGGYVEWMFDNRYQIKGDIKTKWFEASISRSVSTPSFLHQAYRGSHDIWMNDFTQVESNQLKGNLIYQSRRVNILPGVTFSTYRNLVFFKKDDFSSGQTMLPLQSVGYQTVVNPELRLSVILFNHLAFTLDGVYTKILENADDALQLPELFVNSQLAYSNIWFGGNFDFQVGVDAHWKSAYYAYGYDPVVQQYYTQTEYKAPDFPIVDIFLNAKIIRGRIFLRYHNLFKAFSNTGNVPTPFYPGMRNVVDFGFDWSFYD